MSAGLIVLGTDTGVGKTHVASGIALGMRARGLRPGALKPVETGYDDAGCDARRLAEACGEAFDPEMHVPQRFTLPLAPLAAAREEGRAFDLAMALRHARGRAEKCDIVILEAAGGLRVPLDEEFSNLEFASSLGWPALVVARAGLGTINHTVMTLEAAARGGVPLLGFVLNGEPELSSRGGGGNARIIQEMTGHPCLGEIPHGDVDVVAEHVDWAALLHGLSLPLT